MKKTVIFLASLAITLFILSSFPGTVDALIGGMEEGGRCRIDSQCAFGLECSSESSSCVLAGADDCGHWGYGEGNGCGYGSGSGYGYGCDIWGNGYGLGCGSGYGCECAPCSNGVIDEGETCDDENTENGDGCDSECKIEAAIECGNDIPEEGEECDDGNANNEDACSNTCELKDPEVRLFLDLDYAKKTNESRGFSPTTITPFDDIICEVKVVVLDNPPETLEGELITTDSEGSEVLVKKTVETSKFKHEKRTQDEETEVSYDHYYWKIKGWSNGWTQDQEVMKDLIQTGEVTCKVTIDGETPSSDPIKIDLCVHLSGSEKNKIKFINAFGKSANKGSEWIVGKGKENEKELNKIAPFKQYSKDISHYADLKVYDDSPWDTHESKEFNLTFFKKIPEDPSKTPEEIKEAEKKNAYKQIPKLSSCKAQGGRYNFYSGLITRSNAFRGFSTSTLHPRAKPASVVHEIAHSFCELYDEYPHPLQKDKDIAWKNCVEDPSLEAGNGFMWEEEEYGDMQYNNNGKGCDDRKGFFIPSKTSIMKNPKVPYFNVISCGYCLMEINKRIGNENIMEDNFEECMNDNWNTIKPGEPECVRNSDCTGDFNNYCNLCEGGNCIFQGVGKECAKKRRTGPLWDFGVCGKKEDDSRCEINQDWECIKSDPKTIEYCPSRTITTGSQTSFIAATACSEDHKCIYPEESGN
jgi:cysteine-rich repeat protein